MDSNKKTTQLILCIFGGWFGLHHFYAKNIGKGILYLFTVGLFCFGWWIDIYIIFVGKFVTAADRKRIEQEHIDKAVSDLLKKNEQESFYNFLDKYENRMDKYVERYTDACINVSDVCTDSCNPKYYSLEKKLSAIQAAIDNYDKICDFCHSNGGGDEYLNSYCEEYVSLYFSGYSFDGNTEDFSGCNFYCCDFLKFLQDTYISEYTRYQNYLDSKKETANYSQ